MTRLLPLISALAIFLLAGDAYAYDPMPDPRMSRNPVGEEYSGPKRSGVYSTNPGKRYNAPEFGGRTRSKSSSGGYSRSRREEKSGD